MADPHTAALPKIRSPISQVLSSLGLTREDLLRHSDQMRQFLTAEDANSLRVLTREITDPGSTALSSVRERSGSNANASGSRDSPLPPTPATPVKTEPTEHTLSQQSHRTMDNMEMIIERKSRQNKRDKKGRRERGALPAPPSPSPSRAGFSLDTFMHSRNGRRVSTSEEPTAVVAKEEEADVLPVEPVTPQKRKYYREHTESTARARQDTFAPQPESPTPVRYRPRISPVQPTPTQATIISTDMISMFAIPSTPVRPNNYYKSPLPRSSPPPTSSPFSSPIKGSSTFVNLVSSPGPILPLPSESDYDKLPYTLPPGPYSAKKPDASYAALVGCAILSSPGHALTLQEIYDWITIVHPHFKRGETTWMNSIRHVLSTTACFRKQTRERSVGRTLWAIWDCDLECFKNGGFRKQFCKDLMDGKKAAAASRKRPADGEGGERKSKKQKKAAATAPGDEADAVDMVPATFQHILPPLVPASQLHPLFPSMRPASVYQPYYETCVQSSASAVTPEIMFPPLPPSNYQHVLSLAVSENGSASAQLASDTRVSPPPLSSGSMSMPDLTPNGSSSSPIMPSSDDNLEEIVDVPSRQASPELMYPPDELDAESDEKLFSEMLSADALESGFMLNRHDYWHSLDKGKRKAMTPPMRSTPLPPMPVSPSLNRRNKLKSATKPGPGESRTTFPSPPLRPCTPPRNTSSYLQLSPKRTPLSHRGLHMSPSASLAHYKSHLDPPLPSSSFANSGLDTNVDVNTDILRTPSRRRTISSSNDRAPLFPSFPVTPKKLFSASLPHSGHSQDSPFRTPVAGSRHASIYDPHDPGALLDEELSRLGAVGTQDSPEGLYEGRKGLLYESPSMPSPGKWAKWW